MGNRKLSDEEIAEREQAVQERKEQKERIKEDLESGMVQKEVLQKYQIDHYALRKMFNDRVPKAKGLTKREMDAVIRKEQDANMYADSMRGMTVDQISTKYGLAKSTVYQRLNNIDIDLSPVAIQVYRQQEYAKLENLEKKMWGLLDDEYYVVNHGKVMIDPMTGQPMKDSAPVLSTADRILKIMERRAKLGGFDAAVKVDVEHNISEIQVTEVKDLVEQARAEIRQQEEALKARALEAGAVDAEVVSDSDTRSEVVSEVVDTEDEVG